MKSNFLKILVLAAALLLAWSCTTDELPVDGSGDSVDDEKVRLELFTNTHDFVQSASRASAQEGVVGSTPWVLVFNGSGSSAVYSEAVQGYYAGGKTFVELTKTSSACRLLILANPQATFTGAGAAASYSYTVDNFNTILRDNSIATACNLLHTEALTVPYQTSIPFVPDGLIPMSGIYDATSGTAGIESIGTTETPFQLTRAVAKVVVTNNVPGSTLQYVTVVNAPRRGRSHQFDETLKTNNSTDPADRTSYLNSSGTMTGMAFAENPPGNTQSTARSPIYIYESSKDDETQIYVILNIYGSVNYSGHYKLSFRDPQADSDNPNATLDVLRNHVYTFNITKILRNGHPNVAAALAAEHANNEDLVWSISVTDGTAHDIVDNGEYYIGVSNSKYLVYADGDLRKTVALERRPALTGISAPVELEGDYTSVEIESGSEWFNISTDGVTELEDDNIDLSGGSIYFHPDIYVGASNLPLRTAVLYLTTPTEGRVKVELNQKPATLTVPTGIAGMGNSYVGTFHRASEVGERNVRIPIATANAGAWTAQVLDGGDFITLADGFRDGFPWEDSNAESFILTDDVQELSGTATAEGEIRFRVGMKSKLSEIKPDNTTPPRYGRILVSYANNTKYWILYVRQGEAPDYIYSNTESGRSMAKRWPPYNLTAPQFLGAGVTTASINVRPDWSGTVNPSGSLATWTDYPSQSGALFSWSDPTGVFAHNPNGNGRPNYGSTALCWDQSVAKNGNQPAGIVRNLYESCPAGYHRPKEGRTDIFIPTVTGTDSEVQFIIAEWQHDRRRQYRRCS